MYSYHALINALFFTKKHAIQSLWSSVHHRKSTAQPGLGNDFQKGIFVPVFNKQLIDGCMDVWMDGCMVTIMLGFAGACSEIYPESKFCADSTKSMR